MIVKMQKVTILVSERHTEGALSVLRKLGVVHIKHMQKPHADYITSLEHRLLLLDKALTVIGRPSVGKQDLDKEHVASYLKEICDCDIKRQELIVRLKDLEDKLTWFKEWGNVSAYTLAELKKAGVFIKLYTGNKKALKNIPEEKLVYIVNQKGKEVRLYRSTNKCGTVHRRKYLFHYGSCTAYNGIFCQV